MSFSEDPYKHIAVVFRDGMFGWECNSCGADSLDRTDPPKNEIWTQSTRIGAIAHSFWRHIRDSHKLTPDDTRTWS